MVLTPHGELQPYALAISPKKKALLSLLYARRNLKNASCLWALSEQEKSSICDYGYTGRVEMIPNGVSNALLCTEKEIENFRASHGVAPNQRIILFLSRIAPIKNLPLLLRTFARAVKLQPEWVLLIAGSDEKGHIHEIKALINDLGIQKSALLIGPVYGKEKACAFSSASIFTLTSHSEGLPIAVLEAMEYKNPILVTNGWTLPVKSDAEYGWRVPGEEREFESALLEAMRTPDSRLAAMGQNARSIVREQLNWDNIAQQACSLYASVLTNHPRNAL
jgi:glycosyltransferase involved in cell wall biosynthesis